MTYENELVTGSPNYPQSNGRVENTVKPAKQLIKTSKKAGTDFYLALLDWRNTPSEGVGSSPGQCAEIVWPKNQNTTANYTNPP